MFTVLAQLFLVYFFFVVSIYLVNYHYDRINKKR